MITYQQVQADARQVLRELREYHSALIYQRQYAMSQSTAERNIAAADRVRAMAHETVQTIRATRTGC